MKAYNETWVRNKHILEYAARWCRRGLLSEAQLKQIQEKFPVGFHAANGFIEVGLFVFSIVAVSGSYFLLATLLSNVFTTPIFFHFFNIGFGITVGLLANHLIESRKQYRSGVDNALIIA